MLAMNRDIISIIEQNRSSYSKGQLRIAQFIIETRKSGLHDSLKAGAEGRRQRIHCGTLCRRAGL